MIVPQLAAILWVLLTLAWLLVARRARVCARIGDGPIPRWTAAAAAGVLAVLAAGAALALAVAPAWSGRRAIAAGSALSDGSPRAPARARLFLHYVQLALPPGSHSLAVGYGPDAPFRLPAATGGALTEARRGWNLVEVAASGSRGLSLAALPPPEPTDTRVLIAALPDLSIDMRALARRADLVARGCRQPAASPAAGAPVSMGGAGALVAVACAGQRPVIALAFSRPTGFAGAPPLLRVVPLVRRGARFELHHVEIGPRSLLQIGSSADSAPGVELWEVPAPAGATRLVMPPADPFAPCRDWRASMGAPRPGADDSARAADAAAGEDGAVCVLPFSPPFALELRRLLPDTGGLATRSLWAAAMLVLPALGWLLWLAAERRSRLTCARLADALTASWAALVLAGLAAWRLLWAHRIDMLRDHEAFGWRVAQNQGLVVLVAGALAATMASRAGAGTEARRRLLFTTLAWSAALVLGLFALGPDRGALAGGRALAAAFLSVALGIAPVAGPLLLEQLRAAATASAHGRALAGSGLRATPLVGLIAAALVAAIAAASPLREPGFKLALAWTIALLFHAALGTAVRPDQVDKRRLYAAAAAGSTAALAALVLDPGIAAAIVLPGLVFALLFAAHDASFDDRALRQVGSYRRRHAPLAACHAALVLAVGAGAVLWAAAGLLSGNGGRGGEPGRALTEAAFHLPLLVAGFLAPAALLVARRRGRAAAWPWAIAAAAATALWLVREPLLEGILASDSQAASRIALVSDPGYALLRSPERFLAGLTAWRETALPAAASAWTGQGYFGAQLIDPGVLLSIENDYLALLVLRESGAAGLLGPVLLLVGAAAGLFLLAGDRFRRGGAAERRRALAALLLGVLAVYQPLAALGALPLTGLPWPGLGIDSPSDFWLLLAVLLFIAVWGRADDAELDAYDADLRRERRFARLRRAEQAAALLLVAGASLVVTRAAVGAASRPAALAGTGVALDYARGLSCSEPEGASADGTSRTARTAVPGASVPSVLVGQPVDPASTRFHEALQARWPRARRVAAAIIARVAARPGLEPDQCAARAGDTGPWRVAPGDAPGECRLLLALGLPEIEMHVSRPAERDPARITCSVGPPDETLRRLRLPVGRPFEGARVRLVSRAMGRAARDVGELTSGASVVRLRPGGELIALVAGRPGLAAAGRVALESGALVRASEDGAHLEVPTGMRAGDVMLLFRDPQSGGWMKGTIQLPSTPLDRVALLMVTGRGGQAGGVWLFRPRTRWPGPDEESGAVVDPILADDAASAAGPTRRSYPYGGLLPEIGWVNRFQRRRSLGLDGWVRVAVDELTSTRGRAPPVSGSGAGRVSAVVSQARCGTLDPAPADPTRVCALAADGVIECRVSLQPELAVRMRHLTELVSLDPERYAGSGRGFVPPLRSSFALLRGDTGEILAQGEFVPGRSGSLYAPASPAVELRLIRAREDRDLDTGRRLPPGERGEASGEKVEWNQPIAVGSAIKPLVARAFERTDPDLSRRLVLRGAPSAGAVCRGSTAHALLGHCPPTDSLWNHGEEMDMTEFLAVSANWYLGAIGFLGTALPDGRLGLGRSEIALADLVTRDVGDHATDAALWTERDGRSIVTASHAIDLEALRDTPMWTHLEAVVGRRLCRLGDKEACRRAGDRADLCAARAMPVAQPTADLRHLVALGPDVFDFHPGLPPHRPDRASALEYLQFLRGSGIHPLGSLLQLSDAFGRVVYEPSPGPHGYRLAASWFPVPVVARPPVTECARSTRTGDPVRDGLCDVVRHGTAAAALGPLLFDPTLRVYGVKTGTIDSLGDVATNERACADFRDSHTLADRPRRLAGQPYWLACGNHAQPPDDSLLLIAFGVPTPGGRVVPLTLGLRFQRSGAGFAARAARHYIDLVRDYFAPDGRRLP